MVELAWLVWLPAELVSACEAEEADDSVAFWHVEHDIFAAFAGLELGDDAIIVLLDVILGGGGGVEELEFLDKLVFSDADSDALDLVGMVVLELGGVVVSSV